MPDTTPLSPETAPPPTCANCHKTASELQKSLSKCAKCTTRYCSVSCQTHDWTTNNHKAKCAPKVKTPPKPATIPASAFLGSRKYLHTLSERDVFGHLIDCFRLRADDEAVFAGDLGGIYDGQDPRPGFEEFLDLAEGREKLLPGWWNGEKRELCEEMAVRDSWHNIFEIVEKSDIKEHYGDGFMPMKLRILAEKIYGKGLFGGIRFGQSLF
ncbi:MYND domain protein [Rutstroemia sp. NJR-2017a WRK4]|nr:MYND domain protein [Rutstroemia sp. NJR-2017a WRK4]